MRLGKLIAYCLFYIIYRLRIIFNQQLWIIYNTYQIERETIVSFINIMGMILAYKSLPTISTTGLVGFFKEM